MQTAIYTSSQGFGKVLGTNSTDGSFTAKVATITEPVTTALDAGYSGGTGVVSRNIAFIVPYGVGSATNTFDLRIYGWRKLKILWVPIAILEVTCTLCTAVGATGGEVTGSEKFCDTITLASAYSLLSTIEVVSPGSNVPGHLKIDFAGSQKLDFIFANTSSTSANALISQY